LRPLRVRARADSAERPRRCGAASRRPTRGVAHWAAPRRTGSGRDRRSWMDEELIFVDQIQPIQLDCEFAAPEEHAGRRRVLELLYACSQVAGDVMAVGPREVRSRRGHHVLRFGIQLDRPFAYRRRRLHVAASDRRPVAFHHLIGDAAPQHRPALVHEAGEERVRLSVSDALLMVDAAVQGDIHAKGQSSHVTSLNHPVDKA